MGCRANGWMDVKNTMSFINSAFLLAITTWLMDDKFYGFMMYTVIKVNIE
jgi:hypothetical protein